jgi:hypothetical protein
METITDQFELIAAWTGVTFIVARAARLRNKFRERRIFFCRLFGAPLPEDRSRRMEVDVLSREVGDKSE